MDLQGYEAKIAAIPKQKLFATHEAAEYLGVSVRTIETWRLCGILTGWWRRGHSWVCSQATLDAVLSGGAASYYTADEAAHRLGISLYKLHRWAKKGLGPTPVYILGSRRLLRYSKLAVENFKTALPS
jgi:predicted site-specific integrase-resolvase